MDARRGWKKRIKIPGDGGKEGTREKTVLGAVATPLCPACQPPNPSDKPGVLPPQGSVHFASSVAGRFASEVSGKTKYSSK